MLQLEALYALGPESMVVLSSTCRRCRDAAACEDPWWFFLVSDFMIHVASAVRAVSPLPARSLYAMAYRCRLNPLSPWHVAEAEELQSVAETLRRAGAGLDELRALPPLTRVDDDCWYGGDDDSTDLMVRPRVFSDSVRFDPVTLAKVLDLWECGDEEGMRKLPGDELVSDSAELSEDDLDSDLVRIALSLSFIHTTSSYVPQPEDDSDAEFDPLAAPGEGRLLALNLALPDDDHCAIYLAHPDFPVMGRWVWNSETFKINPGNSCQVPRRIFQTRGQPEGAFARMLRAVAAGQPLRVLIISTGVGASCRDICTSSAEESDQEMEKLYDIDDPPLVEETLFGLPMDMPRPWPDLGCEPLGSYFAGLRAPAPLSAERASACVDAAFAPGVWDIDD